ncbi:MAG: 6-carboxytetrahydropterin synthase [Ruminococcus flavefaciens]|nr:6-carboxytetrahydropterin synthase [Ruminococcus flavefaciens]
MYYLKTSASFDSAHFLSGYNGKCANLHGHHWKIEATFTKDSLQPQGEYRGMLIDFTDVKKAVRRIADSLDHATIYEDGTLKAATIAAFQEEGFRLIAMPFRPTAECFAKYIYELLNKEGFPVHRIAIYETPENCAVYEG